MTPVEQHGHIFVKRDDKFYINGIVGGKVRSCYSLALNAREKGYKGLVTAGSRSSPQVNIVAHIAQYLGMECNIHTPQGELSEEVKNAISCGAKIHQHPYGYNNVIVARSREDAQKTGYYEIPFGMECNEAITQTRLEVENIPLVKRIVVPVGSGMSLSGILHGLKDFGKNIPVLGIKVGADPIKRLEKYAPKEWKNMCSLINAGIDYSTYIDAKIGNIVLDPVYEAKCLRFLEPGDLLWIIGCRETYLNKKFRLI